MSNDAELDLIVVGAGLAGHCAALAAAQAGARVLLLEKTDHYGGSTAMCGGSFAFAGTDLQRAHGIEDSAELLYADLTRDGGGPLREAIARAYVAEQADAYAWLMTQGLVFERVSLSSNQSAPRNHSTNPVVALDLLHERLEATGRALYRSGTAVQRLLAGEIDGRARVIGVLLQSGERLVAGAGVVLATGGFSRGRDIVERFAPRALGAKSMGGEGNTGDGIRMAWALGADMLDMSYARPTFGAAWTQAPANDPDPPPRILAAMYRGAIIVNRQGLRFVDESSSYKKIGDRCLDQPDVAGFQIFDRQVMERSAPLPRNVDFDAAFKRGLISRAKSIQELADGLGIDPAALASTIDRYNRACDGKEPDEFGRRSLSGGVGKPIRIDQPPFYGYPCTAALTSTFCGLATNANAEVVDVFGDPIRGLYAVGEVAGGLHGDNYMSGTSLGKGCIFGRIAARHALSAAPAGRARRIHK